MHDYILDNPMYLLFLLVNVLVIYKVIQLSLREDQDDDDEENGGGGISGNDDPDLDLPPGVEPPIHAPSVEG